MTKEEKEHKATFKTTKTVWYKKAITPWVIILSAAVFAAGMFVGWTFRSDFSNEVRSEVKSQMVVVESKNNQ